MANQRGDDALYIVCERIKPNCALIVGTLQRVVEEFQSSRTLSEPKFARLEPVSRSSLVADWPVGKPAVVSTHQEYYDERMGVWEEYDCFALVWKGQRPPVGTRQRWFRISDDIIDLRKL